MRITITTEGRIPTMKVVENGVTCILTLGKSQDIVTKGEDIDGLADRIAYSHRSCFGKNCIGVDYLKLIKADLLKRNGTTEIVKKSS